MQTARSSYRFLTLALCAFAAQFEPARADDNQRQVVPEFNAFIKLSERTRVYLQADVAHGLTEPTTDGELFAHLDITLKPILRPQLREADWERNRYLWVRIGYGAAGNHEGLRLNNAYTEKRVILEMTGRVPLPSDTWLVHRGRVDLRDIEGEYSQRYRYRLGIEREFTAGGVLMVPYAQAEFYYDTRYDAWTRQFYQVGAEIELSKRWRIEPYLALQKDTKSTPALTEILGLILKYYY